ncbi:hypothetical protein [Streptacidiphilus melanogenes]|uniref:hypothetical protein n=1 Tax=Streptacidiphilus melanogenes TaxID=411235 RepID=UPI0013922C0A|nr:hypothetical protein [Streptacidiphilus melanogenes]
MSANLDALSRLLPPPQEAVAAPPWERSKAECGFDFPADYREFVNRFGGGVIHVGPEELPTSVMAPSSAPYLSGDPGGFRAFVEETISGLTLDHEVNCWDGPAYPDLPAPGGLLAWGHNLSGDTFYWSTQDADPDRWPVVMLLRGPAEVVPFDGGMVEFLLAVHDGSHELSPWMTDPVLRWTMETDWDRRHLQISAGPVHG